jgi:hypothetical protein
MFLAFRPNANKSYTEIPSHSSPNGYHQENKLKITNVERI